MCFLCSVVGLSRGGAMAAKLQEEQKKWLQSLLASDKHCDANVQVGPEATQISVHRVLLANISEP